MISSDSTRSVNKKTKRRRKKKKKKRRRKQEDEGGEEEEDEEEEEEEDGRVENRREEATKGVGCHHLPDTWPTRTLTAVAQNIQGDTKLRNSRCCQEEERPSIQVQQPVRSRHCQNATDCDSRQVEPRCNSNSISVMAFLVTQVVDRANKQHEPSPGARSISYELLTGSEGNSSELRVRLQTNTDQNIDAEEEDEFTVHSSELRLGAGASVYRLQVRPAGQQRQVVSAELVVSATALRWALEARLSDGQTGREKLINLRFQRPHRSSNQAEVHLLIEGPDEHCKECSLEAAKCDWWPSELADGRYLAACFCLCHLYLIDRSSSQRRCCPSRRLRGTISTTASTCSSSGSVSPVSSCSAASSGGRRSSAASSATCSARAESSCSRCSCCSAAPGERILSSPSPARRLREQRMRGGGGGRGGNEAREAPFSCGATPIRVSRRRQRQQQLSGAQQAQETLEGIHVLAVSPRRASIGAGSVRSRRARSMCARFRGLRRPRKRRQRRQRSTQVTGGTGAIDGGSALDLKSQSSPYRQSATAIMKANLSGCAADTTEQLASKQQAATDTWSPASRWPPDGNDGTGNGNDGIGNGNENNNNRNNNKSNGATATPNEASSSQQRQQQQQQLSFKCPNCQMKFLGAHSSPSSSSNFIAGASEADVVVETVAKTVAEAAQDKATATTRLGAAQVSRLDKASGSKAAAAAAAAGVALDSGTSSAAAAERAAGAANREEEGARNDADQRQPTAAIDDRCARRDKTVSAICGVNQVGGGGAGFVVRAKSPTTPTSSLSPSTPPPPTPPQLVSPKSSPKQRGHALAMPPASANLLSLEWAPPTTRALSCTESSLSSGSLMAQLAASSAARSKSMCEATPTVAPPPEQLLRASSGARRRVVASPQRAVEKISRKVSQLTVRALSRIRALSVSNPNMPEHDLPEEPATSGAAAASYERRRSSSHRTILEQQVKQQHKTSAGQEREKPPVQPVPHQLNRFRSASSAYLGTSASSMNHLSGALGQPSTGGLSAADREDSELLYSTSGVYIGPGGCCSKRDLLAATDTVRRHKSFAFSTSTSIGSGSGGRPSLGGGGALSWLAPLRLGGAHAQSQAGQRRPPVQPVLIRVGSRSTSEEENEEPEELTQRDNNQSKQQGRSRQQRSCQQLLEDKQQETSATNEQATSAKQQCQTQTSASQENLPPPRQGNSTTTTCQVGESDESKLELQRTSSLVSDPRHLQQQQQQQQQHQQQQLARATTVESVVASSEQLMRVLETRGNVVKERPSLTKSDRSNERRFIVASGPSNHLQQQQQQQMNESQQSSSKTQQQQSPSKTAGSRPWILNLTQRFSYQVSRASPPSSKRSSQKEKTTKKKREETIVVANTDSSHLVHEQLSTDQWLLQKPAAYSQEPAYLGRGGRSSSLSRLYLSTQTAGEVGLAGSGHLSSRSSMELNCHQVVEQTSLYLAELNSRYSASTHELSRQPKQLARDPSDRWFQRSFRSTSNQLPGEQVSVLEALRPMISEPLKPSQCSSSKTHPAATATASSPPEQQRLYGANLQSICVHCQLIAELANHPASAYLDYILASANLPDGYGDDDDGGGHTDATLGPQLRPEIALPGEPLPASGLDSSNGDNDSSDSSDNLADQDDEQAGGHVNGRLARPSVVLTVCSNQATLDYECDDQQPGPKAALSSSQPVAAAAAAADLGCQLKQVEQVEQQQQQSSDQTGPPMTSIVVLRTSSTRRQRHRCRSSSSASLISRSSASRSSLSSIAGLSGFCGPSELGVRLSNASSANESIDGRLAVATAAVAVVASVVHSSDASSDADDEVGVAEEHSSQEEDDGDDDDENDWNEEEEDTNCEDGDDDDDIEQDDNNDVEHDFAEHNDEIDKPLGQSPPELTPYCHAEASKSAQQQTLRGSLQVEHTAGQVKPVANLAAKNQKRRRRQRLQHLQATTAASENASSLTKPPTATKRRNSSKASTTKSTIPDEAQDVASPAVEVVVAAVGDKPSPGASGDVTAFPLLGTQSLSSGGGGATAAGGSTVMAQQNQTLEVPAAANKQARSVSLDAPYLLQVPQSSELLADIFDEAYPGKSNRSRSVDISLPTRPGETYRVRAMSSQTSVNESLAAAGCSGSHLHHLHHHHSHLHHHYHHSIAGHHLHHHHHHHHHHHLSSSAARLQLLEGSSRRQPGKLGSRGSVDGELIIAGRRAYHRLSHEAQKKFIQAEIKVACANGETRALKLFVDWRENCVNGEHLWVYVGSSSEACYVGENECLKHGPRLSCSACKITAHTGCISILIDKIKFICKHTFKDLTINNPSHVKELQQQNVIYHHWVHKRTHCGRCKQCAKTFGGTKLPFSSKEIQAITCSWCKVSYHNKENCYTLSALTEPCTLGAHRESIIPPPWILKLPSSSKSHQQQIQTSANSNSQTTNKDKSDLTPADNLIDLSMTNQINLSKVTCSDNYNKENFDSSLQRYQQQHSNSNSRNQNYHQQPYGSNATIMTDTSGYMSTDVSNAQSLMNSGNNNNNNVANINNNNNNNNNNNSSNSKLFTINRTPTSFSNNTDCYEEVVMDPSALQATDLSLINQTPREQHIYEHLQHPQENMSQYRKHQLKQYYRQLDQNVDQSKQPESDNEEASMMLDIQMMQQQNLSKPSSNGLYQNFRIVPQPIQGVPNAGSKPILVFVNPRSGGNQGAKMMQKFNWLLNPRQVFDLIQSGGPMAALELYKDVPNLRILTIGGDGTASWILSYLDELGISNRIPVAVLPLGTGNDLARALCWGGGYADEPIAKILTQVRDGEVVQLDRWNLHVERNPEAAPSSPNEYSSTSNLGYSGSVNMDVGSPYNTSPYFGSLSQCTTNTTSTVSIVDQSICDTSMTQVPASALFSAPVDEAGGDRLPMDVINNYFSLGVDAQIALEFHTAREAHPERFNSRLRNKMFYGQAGGKDLLKRKWKDLSNFVTLYCDGQDMTSRLKELKVHSVLFLNIPSYGGGTRPWPTTATSFAKPRTDDGLIEVIGLTTYQLPLLQAGGHGSCIAQCRSAKIITSRTIPMQVDGEPCKLLPSIINISFKNRVCMLAKSKSSNKNTNTTTGNMQKTN